MALTGEDIDGRTTALERAQGETTETLRWAVTKLARVQAVQDEHTLRLERLESKVDRLDGRLDKVDTRLDKVDARLDKVDARLDNIDSQLGNVQMRLGMVEAQTEALPRTIAEMIAEMIAASEKRIVAAVAGRS
jgi:chromosome segregation ATPase